MELMSRARRIAGSLLACTTLACCAPIDGTQATQSIGPARAAADTRICEQFGTATIQGRYIVRNNRFGSQTASQCITVTETGFSVLQQLGESTSWKPVSYPSIVFGCHWGACSPGTNLPMQVSDIKSATSSVDFSYVDTGSWDAAYDIYLDTRRDPPAAQQMEIMIHFNRVGLGPSDGANIVGDVELGGRNWQVMQLGPWPDGGREVIYIAPSRIDAWNFSVLDFVEDVRSRGLIDQSWYLTSIQTGFECWRGCTGVGINSFAAAVN